jgi:hypothetical protein
MKKILLSFIMLQSFCANIAYTKEASFEEKTKILSSLIKKFEECCIGTNGEILKKGMCVDKASIQKDGPVIMCSAEASRLAKMLTVLNSELVIENKKAKKEYEKECELNNGAADPIKGSEVMTMMSSTNKIQKKIEADNKCEKQTGSECAADMTCNLTRSILTGPTTLLKLIPEKSRPKVPKCLDASQGSCIGEFITGVLKDIWDNLEGIWELGKMAVNGAKGAVVSAWDWATGVEDKTSDAAHLASKQSESSIKLFLKDPLAFLKKIGTDIWNMITSSIYDNYGCEKWSGLPHVSKCLRPMSNWGCSNCNQKINAVCGVAGVLGGEIAVAYLTVGTLNIASKIGAKGVQSARKLSQILAKALPKTTQAIKSVAVVGKVVTVPLAKGSELATKVLNSETSLKILALAKKGLAPIKSGAIYVAKSAPITLTVKITKIALSPVTGYVKLLDYGAKAGMKGSERLFTKGSKIPKYSEAMTTAEKLGEVDNLVISTSKAETSPELLKMQLKENKILVQEIKLKDGTVIEKFKIDSSCPLK